MADSAMMPGQGTINVPPEVLRDTMSAVISALMQSGQLAKSCNTLVEELLGSGAFSGPTATMALTTIGEVNADFQKMMTHGSALATHLGSSADATDNTEVDSANQVQAVLASLGR